MALESAPSPHGDVIAWVAGREPWATWLSPGGCLEGSHTELHQLIGDALAFWGRPAAPPAPLEGEASNDEAIEKIFDDNCYTDDFGTSLMQLKDFRDGVRAAIARLGRPTTPPAPLEGEVAIGPEWQPCVKLPITVHVREQQPGETHVSTREGITPVRPDDLIMRGVQGEEYPIGRELFQRTYRLGAATPPAEGRGPSIQEVEDLCEEHGFGVDGYESTECLQGLINDAISRWGLPHRPAALAAEEAGEVGAPTTRRACLWNPTQMAECGGPCWQAQDPSACECGALWVDVPARPTAPLEGELLSLGDLRFAWNAQADAFNDWDQLGTDEIAEWAQRQALARWGCRPAPPRPPAPPDEERLPEAAEVYFEYVVFDADSCTQARGIAPTYAQALNEGRHYLSQYRQDGPHRLELRRVEVLQGGDVEG